ncbi:MAG: retropepsin-like aspartic protease [Gemmatimonadota bacterium]
MKRTPLLEIGLLLAVTAACRPTGPSRVEAPADSAAGEVAFRMAGPQDVAILVPVRLNGTGPYDFVLDTGATLTCLHDDLADSLGLPEPAGMLGYGAGVGSGGGIRLVEIDSIAVGAAQAFDLTGCVLDLAQARAIGIEADGLLGLNFLGEFHVQLDFEHDILTLSAPRP